MKKIELLSLFLAFSFGSAFIQAQDLDMPPGSVMRMTNCSIVGDRLDFEDILERAKAIEFD